MDSPAKKPLKILCPGCQRKLDVTDIPAFSGIHCPVCDQKITVPKPFATFLLEDVLSEGPTATVYRGHDLTLDREIAVRIVSAQLRQSPETVALFLAQARKIAGLVHPTILPIYACGEWEGQPYLTMQFMPNFSLARHWGTSEKPLELDFCLDTMLAVTSAMDRAWTQGILHHHLSPTNILLDEDLNVKTADFGLAQAAWNPALSPCENLRAGSAAGCYVSPERGLTGKQDARGDIYSLGAVFYHLLTGRPPFPDGISGEEFGRRVGEQIQPPKSCRPDLPDVLSRLVMQMLSVTVESRPQTYGIIQTELETLKRGAKQKRPLGRRRPAGIRKPAPSPVVFTNTGDLGTGGGRRTPAAAPPTPKHPNPLYTLGILLCIAALVALVIIAGIRRAAWYVGFVEPVTTPVVQWLQQHASRTPLEVQEPPPLPANADLGAGLEIGADDSGGESPAIELPAPAPTRVPEAAPGQVAAASRLPAAVLDARPRPADIDFFRVEGALRAYVRQVPEAQRTLERERIRELSTLRKYLLQLMKFVPYDDEKRGVVLRDGTVLKGTTMGNDREVVIRQRSKSRKLTWEELAPQQYVNFFEFYINMRLSHADPTAAEGSTAQNRKDAGGDAYRVALLCDWYGRGADAVRFARSAANWDPALRPRLADMLPGVPLGK